LFITLCCFSFINQIIFNIFNFLTQMNIFVSNINYATKDYELQDLFSEFGEVSSVKIITDKETGRSRGFGFIEMEDAEGQQAIEALNQKEFNGKELNVSEAKPREEKPRRTFGNNTGGNRSGGGGYGGGNRSGGGGYSGGGNGGKRW
jgi:RNA recognition motif-containing protein